MTATTGLRNANGADTMGGMSLDWQRGAECEELPPDLFFPKGDNADVAQAREACMRCAVRSACLAYALEHHIEFGVWGGTTQRERERMTRSDQRRAIARGAA